MRLRFLIIASLFVTLTACGRGPDSQATGYLYFAAGSYLGQFDLSDGSSTVVANLNDANIKRVSELGGDRILLSLVASSNNREINRISWIDVKTGQLTNLYEGVLAVYLPETRTYVYDDGSRLLAAATTTRFETDAEILRHRLFDATAIIPVSGEELLFEVGRQQDRQVFRYNVMSGNLQELPKLAARCELRDALFLFDVGQLACASAQDNSEYILSTLAGELLSVVDAPKSIGLRALLYVPQLDAIIFSENYTTWLSGERRSRVWMHELSSGRNSVLSENQSLGTSIVYRAY
ncbi:MAG: hypothetical protein K0U72_06145 [Gammaproteobacteria bacterium]|nr:hypothetical protein [Gammaproteobacteria bacterium]